MFINTLQSLEAEFFRGLNQFVEPLVRAGFGAPIFTPVGAIVIETTGRKTGRSHNVPLLASVVGDLVVVSTVRRRSQWLKNITAQPEIRYWIGGRERKATAALIARDVETPSGLPARASFLAGLLKQHSTLWGTSFAILIPCESDEVK